jgi:hypothetical protein
VCDEFDRFVKESSKHDHHIELKKPTNLGADSGNGITTPMCIFFMYSYLESKHHSVTQKNCVKLIRETNHIKVMHLPAQTDRGTTGLSRVVSVLSDRGSQHLSLGPLHEEKGIRTHQAAAKLRHYRPVGHRFPATKSRPQAHLREEDKDSGCPGYKYPRPWHPTLTGGGREPVENHAELGMPMAW